MSVLDVITCFGLFVLPVLAGLVAPIAIGVWVLLTAIELNK